MLMYRVDPDKSSPVPVECPMPKYPARDADGNTIYENTHFATVEDAWSQLQNETEAGVRLDCDRVNELRSQLAKAESRLVEQTLIAEAVKANRKQAICDMTTTSLTEERDDESHR